jgi:8-oxo-dGTP diphosphatase
MRESYQLGRRHHGLIGLARAGPEPAASLRLASVSAETNDEAGSGRPLVAVGAIAVRAGALLMVRRAQEPARGLWTIPGGRVEAGEYLAQAVRREVREETGLEVEVGGLVGIFEVLGDPHFVILDFLAEVVGEGRPAGASDVSEARWVPLEEVAELECTPRFVETLRGWGVLP